MQLTELEVWRAAIDLSKMVYESSVRFMEPEPYGLAYQLRRTVVTIPSHIAAAASRKHGPDALRSLSRAKDSIYETESQLFLAEKLGFLATDELNSILEQLESSRRLLFGFIKYYKKNTNPGSEH
jgi:four helix bundle protein